MVAADSLDVHNTSDIHSGILIITLFGIEIVQTSKYSLNKALELKLRVKRGKIIQFSIP